MLTARTASDVLSLAAGLELSGNSRLGFASKVTAQEPGLPFANLQSTLGMHVSLRETRGGSRIQTWNRYAYVANNPLSFIDPLGLYRCIVDGVETDNCPYGGVGGGGGGGGFPIYTTWRDIRTGLVAVAVAVAVAAAGPQVTTH